MTVPLKFNMSFFCSKRTFFDISFFDFPADKFINNKNIFRKCSRGGKVCLLGQIYIFIPKSKYSTGLYAKQRSFFINNFTEYFYILICYFFCMPYQAF